jgi:nucleotide sugar dehydrogenase
MDLNVCVIGLGEVGLPTALYVANQKFETWTYDINEIAVNKAKQAGIKATLSWSEIPHETIDAYIVCVSTSLDSCLKPDMSAVINVCRRIKHSKKGKVLVSLESTLAIGTCRKIYADMFNHSVNLVHVPHRFWKDDPVNHGVKQLRVIGGVNERSLEAGLEFYKRKLAIPLHAVSSVELAEMSKVVENSYRFLQIAFAEELRMICDERRIDADELRIACNTKWNTEILEARDGILRHCLPKDIMYLMSVSEQDEILKSAIEIDLKYRKYLQRK